MGEQTFKHSGALGDIIYSLPTIKALGGGVLYLDIEGGKDEPAIMGERGDGRIRFDRRGYDTIRPLLLEQPYLKDVSIWEHQPVDHNLNDMRKVPVSRGEFRILDAFYASQFPPGTVAPDAPWLTLKSEPIKLHKPIIVNRTGRYQQKDARWEMNKPHWLPNGIFIGLEIEHRMFEHTFDCKIDFFKTNDALEIARVLLGAKLLIANQSFVMAIAIGLGIPFIQETYEPMADCVFKRANAQYF
jgi:hypothetical protein